MKFSRLIALVIATLAVYLAQYIFDNGTFAGLLRPGVASWLPGLGGLLGWSSEHLQSLALALGALGALLFGVVARPWPRSASFPSRSMVAAAPEGSRGWLLVVASLGLGLALTVVLWRGGRETLLLQAAWALSLILFGVGCWFEARTFRRLASGRALLKPSRTWLLAVGAAVLALFLVTWQLETVPVRIDGDAASHGLQSLAILTGAERRLFAPGWAQIPLLAYYPAALGMLLSGDWLVGNRLAGVAAGMLTLLGVWLLAREFYRYAEQPGAEEESGGREVSLFAVGFTAIGYTFVHFSRLPQYMEPVAWGTLSLWALQRGVRTGDRLALGASGLLLGLTSSLYYSGRVFAVIALFWWLWYLLFRRRWLARVRGVGWAGFGLWLAGAGVFLAPIVGYWLHSPGTLVLRAQEVLVFNRDQRIHMEGVYQVEGIAAILLENLKRVLLTVNLYGDTSTHFGWDGPLLDSLTAPLFLLGLGLLLLNLDRLLSWQLLLWLGCVAVLGGVITINAPFWPRLLPALPAAGLIVGLAVDRWRATLVHSSGPWMRQAGFYVAAGLLVLAGIRNWVGYYEVVTTNGDPASHIGRASREIPPERPLFLLTTADGGGVGWDNRAVAFLVAKPYVVRALGELDTGAWPPTLPPASTVLLLPSERSLSSEIEARYPGGVHWVQRNRRGDPVLYGYQMP